MATPPARTATRLARGLTTGKGVCIGAGGNHTGPVTVAPGGVLDLEGGRITGPLTATGAASVRICGATITGPLTISSSSGLVLVGGDDCDPNTIVGPVRLTGNTGGVEFNGNRVIGSPATPGRCTQAATPSPGRPRSSRSVHFGEERASKRSLSGELAAQPAASLRPRSSAYAGDVRSNPRKSRPARQL